MFRICQQTLRNWLCFKLHNLIFLFYVALRCCIEIGVLILRFYSLFIIKMKTLINVRKLKAFNDWFVDVFFTSSNWTMCSACYQLLKNVNQHKININLFVKYGNANEFFFNMKKLVAAWHAKRVYNYGFKRDWWLEHPLVPCYTAPDFKSTAHQVKKIKEKAIQQQSLF